MPRPGTAHTTGRPAKVLFEEHAELGIAKLRIAGHMLGGEMAIVRWKKTKSPARSCMTPLRRRRSRSTPCHTVTERLPGLRSTTKGVDQVHGGWVPPASGTTQGA